MNPLQRRIADLIAVQGPISVAQFTTMAMLDRDYGYYATNDPFGTAGDFTTGPEISQMFGEIVGLWCVQVWHDQGKPGDIRLVELGPGRGTLMSDALRAMSIAPEFVKAAKVTLIEASPKLREAQAEILKDSPVAIDWRDQFDDRLTDRPFLLIANEFFDALPVRQFVKTTRGWNERMVMADTGGALSFALSPVVADEQVPLSRRDAPDGGVYETSSAATALVEQIARGVARFGGGALIVDYGYDAPGFGETLQAVSDHGAVALFDVPGEVDISAHVDFTALADAVARGGAASFGPVGQGAFLTDLGIRARADRLSYGEPSMTEAIQTDLNRLIAPEEMGTLFKVLGVMPKGVPKPPGFEC